MRSVNVRRFTPLILPLLITAALNAGAFCVAAAADSTTTTNWAEADTPNAADELLQDGLDAIADDRPDFAREAFEYLLVHHPAAAAAPRARAELARLNATRDNADINPSARIDRSLDNRTDHSAEKASDPETAAIPVPDASGTAPSTVTTVPSLPKPTPAAKFPPEPARESARESARALAREPAPEFTPELTARPLAAPARPAEDFSALSSDFNRKIGDRVFFAESNVALGSNAKSVLMMQARWLVAKPNVALHVVGHADDLGSAASNAELSQRRAEAVRDHLILSGIDPARITIEAVGSGQPIAMCSDAACRTQNRRAVVTLKPFVARQAAAEPAPATAAGTSRPAITGSDVVRQ